MAGTLLFTGACRPERGTPFRCTCTFTTDFDDDVRRSVEVCAQDLARSGAVASGCAQSGAPGPVQGCTCAEAGTPGGCEVGICVLKEE